jgi:hypothetical protein
MKIEVLHGKILHSVAGDVVEVNHLPVGPPGLPVASCLLLMAKTLLLLRRGWKEYFDRISSKLCWRLGSRRLLRAGVNTSRTLYLKSKN